MRLKAHFPRDVVDPRTGKVLAKKGRVVNRKLFHRLKEMGIELPPLELKDFYYVEEV